VPFAVVRSLHCSGFPQSFREIDHDQPPCFLNVVNIRIPPSPPISLEPDQNVTTDANGMVEGTVRRLITYSIRLPMDHYTTIWLCRVPRTSSNWQTTQAPYAPKPLGACMPTLIRLSLRLFESLTIPRLLHLHTQHPSDAPLLYRTNQPSIAAMACGSIGTSSMDISPVGDHLEKRTSGLTSVHIFLWCKIYAILSENGAKSHR